MSDDDLTPFAFGAIYGTRSWHIDREGYLTGVVYKQRWLPGENHATCRRISREHVDPVTGRSWIQYTTVPADDPGLPIKPGHMVVCGGDLSGNTATRNQGFGGCGFHAYLEGSNDYRASADASGVVALYGRGVRGTRGGRFMKARIVALFVPRDLDAMLADPDHHRRIFTPGLTTELLQRGACSLSRHPVLRPVGRDAPPAPDHAASAAPRRGLSARLTTDRDPGVTDQATAGVRAQGVCHVRPAEPG